MRKMRKGFTLVELLIVITIIGMLSAMMMVSNSEAQNAARATKITEGFRSLTAAVMMYYNEDPTAAEKLTTGTGEATIVEGAKKYIKNDAVFGDAAETASTYYVKIDGDTWWLTYTLATANVAATTGKNPQPATGAAINDLLIKKAKELGLKSETKQRPKEAAAYNGEKTMYLNVR